MRITNCLQELRGIEDAFEKNNAEFHKKVEKSYVQFSNELAGQQAALSEELKNYEQEEDVMREVHKLQNEKVTLNVGGSYFVTSSTTLTRDPDSMLAIMLQTEEPDPDGSYFLDRDSTYFRLILNFLRDLKIPQKAYEDHRIMDELMQEARYYRINDLLKLRWTSLPIITQEDLYRQYPVPTSNKQPTVFNLQQKNLAGLDFSRYHIDAKSNFSGSNLEACNFLNATFGFDFDNKINFSNAYLHKTKFPRPDGREDLVQEFNTDGAILDNSHHSI
ncbi:BTB/POZ protein [Fennellomyces sp. T-0311]|nr:BTB/POZ protein [Fennellomyces sp. T-0311]